MMKRFSLRNCTFLISPNKEYPKAKYQFYIKLFCSIIFCIGINLVGAQNRIDKSLKNSPNIVFILSDDHSVPYLGCYGNKDLKTPNIDKLANEGIRFDKAYVTAPQCVPSRASIMTGRNTIDIRMSRFTAPLPQRNSKLSRSPQRNAAILQEFVVEIIIWMVAC